MLSFGEMLALIVVLSFAPSLVYLLIIKMTRWPGRSIGPLLVPFLWGAVGAVVIAVIASFILGLPFELLGLGLLTAVFVAPVVEEPAKAMGLLMDRKQHLRSPGDGMAFGAAVGLGFASTENVVYALFTWFEGGSFLALGVLFFRTISSSCFHAVASGVAGLGWAYSAGFGGNKWASMMGIAMLLHGAFNFIALVAGAAGAILLLLGSWAGFAWLALGFRRPRPPMLLPMPTAQMAWAGFGPGSGPSPVAGWAIPAGIPMVGMAPALINAAAVPRAQPIEESKEVPLAFPAATAQRKMVPVAQPYSSSEE